MQNAPRHGFDDHGDIDRFMALSRERNIQKSFYHANESLTRIVQISSPRLEKNVFD
jgi:hypothetical protein